ncbi:unnamed protein product [marine sediment metagenome]|uniref:Uncharacterized protein n=1 Tax=marine sediment metagenome TaxID=412755 RepID=X1N7Y3_9ZZZZ
MVGVVERAVTTYDDDMMGTMLMPLLGLLFLMAILPVTQSAQAQAYQGRTVPKTVKATDSLSYLDVRYDYPYTLWISAYFINDGPNSVEIAINYPDDKFTIRMNETITVSRSGAQERIATIFYNCLKGKTATVRITGEY